MEYLALAILAAAIGFGVSYKLNSSKKVEVEEKGESPIVAKTPPVDVDALIRQKGSEILSKAEREADQIRSETEERARKVRKELTEQEAIQVERERSLTERAKLLDQKSGELEKLVDNAKEDRKGIEKIKEDLESKLEKISGLTRDEAKKKLLEEIEENIVNYKAKLIREAEQKAEEVSDNKAKNILVESMQRIVTDYVGETTTSSIKVDDDAVKGRIIGKEGRNIRAFEKATGVDVIVDESPTSIGLSSFDPLRREIAKVAMTELIKDGRIHPGSIEDAIRKAKNQIAAEIKKNGEILADEANWPGMDLGLVKLVGKMKYRTSYGQSLMKHSIEVIRAAAVIAAEVGADVDLVKKAALLHDVGKVLTHKVEGAHHHISGQIARKYNLPDKLVNAIEAHHLDIEPQSPEAVIVYLADAVSGARPGARKDSYEQYIKRVEALENVAKEVAGNKIDEVFAIHAGRELRVVVKPKMTTDEEITVMSKEIADKIQETQQYPGTVEVTVIRENRSTSKAM